MITEKGQSIEDKSFEIIDGEIGRHNYSEDEWPIVRRVIHATADFDFARENMIIFHKDAIQSGIKSLKIGCNIVVDVDGVIGGINKENLRKFGNKVICNISEPNIASHAKKFNKTRAQTSMRMTSSEMNGGIVVIGNAPTALGEVVQMIKEKATQPALVIGVPVGFVCAVESKEELQTLQTPYITNKGRKGGSPCASAIVNALFKLLKEKSSS
ncbi:MAG: precorrin-8X methylmutase [Nitrososphaerota archaeon]